MNKTIAKKYLNAIQGNKKKFLTCESLSKTMGIYPEVIASNLAYFEPLLAMQPSYNLKDLVPQIETYILEETNKAPKKQHVIVSKGNVNQYDSVADFVYKKMTVGGLVDRNVELSVVDLKILKKLIQIEIDEKK